MTRSLRWACVLLLAAWGAGARAQDGSDPPPAGVEAEKDALPAHLQALVDAHEAADQETFEKVADEIEYDAWMVVDALLLHGQPDVALAYALARKGPETARLPEYIEGRRNRPHHPALRDVIERVPADISAEAAEERLRVLDGVAGQGDALERVLVEQRRGELLRSLRRHDEAAEVFMSVGTAAESLGWLSLAAEAYLASGMEAYDALDFAGMLEAFPRAATVEQGRGRKAWAGMALMHVGSTYSMIGDYDACHRYYEEAEGLIAEGEWSRGHAWVLQNRAEAYRQQGRYSEVQATIERARGVFDAEAEPDMAAGLDNVLAAVLMQFGQHEEALALYEHAYDVFLAANDREEVANALGNIGRVLHERGRYDASLAKMEEARAIHEELGNRQFIAICLVNIGWTRLKMGDLEAAIPHLEHAVEIARDVGDGLIESNALDNLADAYRRLGRIDEARELHENVVQIGARLESARVLMSGHLGLCEEWLAKGEPDRAFRAAQRALEYSLPMVSGLAQDQAADARQSLTKLFDAATRAALAWDSPAAMLEAMESARAGALLESLENREALRAASVPEDLREAELEAKRAVRIATLRFQNALESGVVKSIRRHRGELDRAREDLHAVVGRIQRTAKAAASVLYPEPVALDDVQAELDERTVLVSYALAGEKAVALVVTRDAARIVELGPTEALTAAATARLDEPGADGDAALARMRALLVEPLTLPDAGTRLLVSPDGVLGYVPFGALVGDRTVAYVPSATAYRTLGEAGGALVGRGVLALGDPDYRIPEGEGATVAMRSGDGLVPLPATRKEAQAVGDVVLLGPAATPAGLRAAVVKRPRWRAIHLACHGVVDAERPMRSALALSVEEDGTHLLTCLDVVQTRMPADLAVLSACETGRGKVYRSEGIVGLTQAFMLAGVPRVIVSLWKVDDEATQALMTRLYELWRPESGPGLPLDEALAKAQAHVRSQERWRHPRHWAAWVLWGLPE